VKLMTYLGPKTLLASVALGFTTALMAWLILPPPIRTTVPLEERGRQRVAFSRDCRFVAWTPGEMKSKRQFEGELRAWDTRENRLLFTHPYSEFYPPIADGGYSMAFTPEADKLVVYSWGRPKFYLIPSGEVWEPEFKHEFPHDAFDAPSWLAPDPAGNLFVAARDRRLKTMTVRDLWTAKVAGEWNGADPDFMSWELGSVILEESADGMRVREIPTGKLHPPLAMKGEFAVPAEYTATPDGRVVAAVASKIYVWTDGELKQYDLPANQFPALSPDSHVLAALIPHGHAYRDWRTTVLTALGLRAGDNIFVIHDLTAGREIARLKGGHSAHFSRDGKTLVLTTETGLEIYDLPLRAPWGRIAGVGVACAAGIFLAGQGFRWRRMRRIDVVAPSKHQPERIQSQL